MLAFSHFHLHFHKNYRNHLRWEQREEDAPRHLLHPWSRPRKKSKWLPTKPSFTFRLSLNGTELQRRTGTCEILPSNRIQKLICFGAQDCSWSIGSACWFGSGVKMDFRESGYHRVCVCVCVCVCVFSPLSQLGKSPLQVRSHWHMSISVPTTSKPG